MMVMKVDMDDLRRDFEEFKAEEERGRVLVGGPRGEVASPQPAGVQGETATAGELPPALRATGWNRRRAAKILGIGERTLYRKIRKYELGADAGS